MADVTCSSSYSKNSNNCFNTYLIGWLSVQNSCPFVVFLLVQIWLSVALIYFALILRCGTLTILLMSVFVSWTWWIKTYLLMWFSFLIKSSCCVIQCFSIIHWLSSYDSAHNCSLGVLEGILGSSMTINLCTINIFLVNTMSGTCSYLAGTIIIIGLNVHVYFLHVAARTSCWRM